MFFILFYKIEYSNLEMSKDLIIYQLDGSASFLYQVNGALPDICT
jgi:hypothetical protein